MGGRGWQQPGQGHGGDAFARTAFADDGQRFPFGDREGDTFDRLDHGAVIWAERDAEVFHGEQTHVNQWAGPGRLSFVICGWGHIGGGGRGSAAGAQLDEVAGADFRQLRVGLE